ncbi:MAG: hypothetical protein LUC98_09080 [Lachnospiraceae bacterium]|nr:hypothetical protein [Lachnospiraceae bacterium]
MKDILLIIVEPELRARIHTMLDKMPEYRFLDEALNGSVGLEKALTMNPDIVIVSQFMVMLSLEDLLRKLSEGDYIGKILVVGECDNINVPLEYSDTLSYISEESMNDSSLGRALNQLDQVETSLSQSFSKNMYQSILECRNVADFVVLKDKYQMDVRVNARVWILALRVFGASDSAAKIVENYWGRWKKILKQYKNGYVFFSEEQIFFLVNDSTKIQSLVQEIYQDCRRLFAENMSLFVSAPIDQFSGLAAGLKRAGKWSSYVFFEREGIFCMKSR